MTLEEERQRVLRRDAEWAALSSEGRDVEGILSYWTDDARVFPPGLPAFGGKPALRSYVETSLAIPGFHISWGTTDAILSPDGRMACLLSTNVVTMAGPEGQPVSAKGRAVTVWRREAGGEWRCAIDIWNAGPTDG